MSGRFIELFRKNKFLLVLLAPAAILFGEIIFAGRVLFWGVPMMQFVPWYQAAVDAVRVGEWPLWNSMVGNGAPLLANYQVAVFYPPNWLHLLIPPARAMTWLMVLHVLWAGLGMYAFARAIGLRPFPRLISALSFMFGGYLVSRLGFPSIGSTLPWLPWLLWAAERLARKPNLDRGLVLGICLGMQWLAGHAQTSFYSGLALGAYLLWRWRQMRPVQVQQTTKRRWRRLPTLFGLAALIGLGLAAVQLLPTAELQRLSQRAAGLDTDFAMTYSLWPLRLIAFFAPRFFGHPTTGNYWGYCCNYWEDNGYLGLLPLLLALGAMVMWARDQRSRDHRQTGHSRAIPTNFIPFFGAMALAALILAFGVHTPIFPFLFEHVPGFDLFQAPARFLALWSLAVSVLAGIGAQGWRPTRRVKTAGRYSVIVGLALLIAAAGSAQMLAGQTRTFIVGVGQLGFSLVLIGALILYQPRTDDQRRRPRWVALVLLFVAADLLLASWGANPTVKASLYAGATESAAALRAAGLEGRTFYPADDEYQVTFGRYLSFQDFGPSQTAYWFGLRETLLPDMGMLDGIPTANNFDPLRPARHEDLLSAIEAASPETQLKLLQMMGVETLISAQEQPGFSTVHANDDAVFAAVPDPLPRAYAIFAAETVSGPAQALEAISDPTFDPRSAVVLEGESALAIPLAGDTPSLQPLSLTATPNTITIRASLPADGYVVLLDSHYPGWRAAVDGRPATIYAANSAFRAVPVPAGDCVVEFRYQPLVFQVGVWISAGTALLLVLVWPLHCLLKKR